MLTLATVLAGLKWDPTVRGILFPGIQFVVLVGSSYLILSTNLGNRLGFLLANAAFWGWMVLMTIVWMIYGIGLKGNPPSWHAIEVITDTKSAQYDKVAQISNDPDKGPRGDWKPVKEGTPTRGEAQSAVDAYLVGKADGQAGLFTSAAEFAPLDAYERGGEQRIKLRPRKEHDGDWWNPGDYRFMGLLHGKHYYVQQVQAYEKDALGRIVKGADNKPVIDTAAPVYTVVMLRNSGNLRQPPFQIFLASLILLLVSTWSLHRRDKAVMAEMKGSKLTPARA